MKYHGWAVCSRKTLWPGDPSTSLHIIPVREFPGAVGSTIPAKDGAKVYPITYGTVVRSRNAARRLKDNEVSRMGLTKITRQDHDYTVTGVLSSP